MSARTHPIRRSGPEGRTLRPATSGPRPASPSRPGLRRAVPAPGGRFRNDACEQDLVVNFPPAGDGLEHLDGRVVGHSILPGPFLLAGHAIGQDHGFGARPVELFGLPPELGGEPSRPTASPPPTVSTLARQHPRRRAGPIRSRRVNARLYLRKSSRVVTSAHGRFRAWMFRLFLPDAYTLIRARTRRRFAMWLRRSYGYVIGTRGTVVAASTALGSRVPGGVGVASRE